MLFDRSKSRWILASNYTLLQNCRFRNTWYKLIYILHAKTKSKNISLITFCSKFPFLNGDSREARDLNQAQGWSAYASLDLTQ